MAEQAFGQHSHAQPGLDQAGRHPGADDVERWGELCAHAFRRGAEHAQHRFHRDQPFRQQVFEPDRFARAERVRVGHHGDQPVAAVRCHVDAPKLKLVGHGEHAYVGIAARHCLDDRGVLDFAHHQLHKREIARVVAQLAGKKWRDD
ncbi:hypothetical protein D3C72_1647580 [compost metagenome]